MTHFLALPDVLMIQAMTIRHIGGIHGITEQGFERLATALAAPQQSMFGEDLYPDVPAKAAALFDALVSGHCFSDGNKRTALLSMIEFLARNQALLRQKGVPLAVMTQTTDRAGRQALHDAGASAVFFRQADLDAYRHEAAAMVSFWARHQRLDAVGM